MALLGTVPHGNLRIVESYYLLAPFTIALCFRFPFVETC